MSHRSLATHARSWGLPSKEALCPQRGVKDLGRDERWGGRGKWGEAALGPEPCVFGGGKGIMSFIRLLPGVLSDWTFPSSGRLQTVPSRSLMLPFCLPWVHALVDLPSKTGSTVSSVCVCVCVGTLRFVHEPTFESRHPVGGESDRTDNRNVT